LVDAAAFPYFAMKIYRTQDVCEWYTTNLAFGITSGFTVAGLKALNGLPAQYKTVLEGAARDAVARHVEIFRKEEEDGLAAMKAKNLQSITYSAQEIANFVELGGKPIWDEWVAEMVGKGFPGRELLDYVLTESRRSAS
jgi:TRAP-type C4-dicarboxylate transport system substrate-binding protein